MYNNKYDCICSDDKEDCQYGLAVAHRYINERLDESLSIYEKRGYCLSATLLTLTLECIQRLSDYQHWDYDDISNLIKNAIYENEGDQK